MYEQSILARNRLMRIFLVVAFLSLIVAVSVVAAQNNYSSSPHPENACTSEECVKTAYSILSSMNKSADPCEDFYTFTCGNWKSKFNDEGKELKDNFDGLQNKISQEIRDFLEDPPEEYKKSKSIELARNAYSSCINLSTSKSKNNVTAVVNMFQKFNGWPILQNDKWKPTDWKDSFVKSIKIAGKNTLFGITVLPSITNSSRFVIALLPSTASSPFDETTFDKLFNKNSSEIKNKSLFNDDIQALNSFIKELNQINVSEVFNETTTTIGKLQKMLPQLNWLDLLQSIINDALPNDTLTDKEEILVKDILYIQTVLDTINHTDSRIIQNFIGWKIVLELISLIDGVRGNVTPVKSIISNDYSEANENHLFCTLKISSWFNLPIDFMYLQDKDMKEDKTSTMIKYLQEEFEELVGELDWLDNKTRKHVLEKADAMTIVSSPSDFLSIKNRLKSLKEIDEFYSEFPAMNKYDAITNYIQALQYDSRDVFRYLRKEVILGDILPTLTVVNAYYLVNKNALIFPLGIQHPPFYDKNLPNYVNFGAIGSVIGHEITHGFDNTGKLYDLNGNVQLTNAWSNKTQKAYDVKSKCFIDQYNEYKYPLLNNKTENGLLTLGENIADNGGIRQSFLAYQKWIKNRKKPELRLPGLLQYSPEQLFFMSFGHMWCITESEKNLDDLLKNSHALNRFRVIGSLSNFDEFSNVFKCKKNTAMNPSKKCVLW